MMALTPVSLNSVAVIGTHCAEIAIRVGVTLLEIARDNPDLVVHALVLTGCGTDCEVEEKNAFAAVCPSANFRLTVADPPDGRLPDHWGKVKEQLAEFRRDCEPDVVFGPQRREDHQNYRLVAELMRVRGVHCRARYAEAFTMEKALFNSETNYSVN